MKLSQAATNIFTHVLVMGDPGSGKSTLVSQLAKRKKLIWFSFDNGHSVLKKLPLDAQDNIELVVVPDTRDYPAAVDCVRALLTYKECNFCYQHGKNNCSVCLKATPEQFTKVNLGAVPKDTVVVIDNLSQLADSYMSLICKGQPVDYKPKLDDWGSLRFHLLKLLGDIQVAPFDLIAICHTIEEVITDGSKKIMPMVGSSTTAPKVGGYFDHVVYCSVQNKTHKAGSSTSYITNVLTKSRTDIAIENFPAPDLLPFITGEIPKMELKGEKR
jgi:hypothetical protein